MKHFIFTNSQKETLLEIFKGIIYSPYTSHFSFVEITENRWALPETVSESEDVLKCITPETKIIIDEIMANTELREILFDEQLNKNL